MKPPVKTSFRGRDVAYLVISIVLVGVGYAAYRGLYFVGENVPFAQEMILVFLGAAATIYLTAVLLNRQTELELRKEGQVLLFQQKHDTYMRVIEKVAEIVERERHVNRPGFRRHLAAINYGLGGGGYEYETLHG
ncbi:hypothetical protein [Stenotrophomonas maltophilia]|nr:hypothetical protein [Stenotrophomonas maltophilia]